MEFKNHSLVSQGGEQVTSRKVRAFAPADAAAAAAATDAAVVFVVVEPKFTKVSSVLNLFSLSLHLKEKKALCTLLRQSLSPS